MTVSMQSSLLKLACGTALGLGICCVAQASQVGGWWGGSWTCTIDGRPAKMQWNVVSTDEGGCDGPVCTSSQVARWKGRFSDNGSRWVPLSQPREVDKGGLFFNHADGNRWYLGKPSSGRSVGWTTWNGQRYPLVCQR